MYKKFALFCFFAILFSCCVNPDQSKETEAEIKFTPAVISPVSFPHVVMLDTCPKPEVIIVDGKKESMKSLYGQNAKDQPLSVFAPRQGGEAGGVAFIQNYNTEQGLALSGIACGYKDRAGNLWFGTYGGGVSKFDGGSFTNYNTAQGLAGNVVNSILEDTTGNLWFGTNGGGVSRYNGRYFENYTTAHGLANNKVHSIVEDKLGNIWLGTDGGLSKYNVKGNSEPNVMFTNYTSNDGLIGNSVYCIAKDRGGSLWLGTNWGISVFNPEMSSSEKAVAFTNYTQADGLFSNNIRAIIEDIRGVIWVGSDKGISRSEILGNRTGKKSFSPFTEANTAFQNQSAVFIFEDRVGNIWLSVGKGVTKYSFENNSLERYTVTNFATDQGLASNSVYCVVEDRIGNLWFGTSGGGLSKYEGKSVVSYTEAQGLIFHKVWCITEDDNNKIWLGTSSGFSKYTASGFENYIRLGKIAKNARGFVKDTKGNVWCASAGGLSKYDGSAFTCYTVAQGLLNDGVLCVTEDGKGNIWCGTYGGGASKFDGKSFANFTTAQGLASNIVKSVMADKDGNIWLGTNGGGVSKYNGEHFVNYTTAQGLPNNAIYDILQDRAGNIWFGTAGGGVSKFDGKSFTTYSVSDGLSDDVVYAIEQDTVNNILWFGTNLGLSGLHINSLSSDRPYFENFNNGTGYPIKDINTNSLFIDSKGILWAGTGDKLVRFDYKEVKRNKETPVVHIRSLKLQGEKVSWHTLHASRANNNKKVRRLDSLAMINEEVITFKYILKAAQRNEMREKYEDVGFDSIHLFYPIPHNLILPHRHNSITFDFGAIETGRPQLVKYQFKLEGYDADWSPVTNENFARFGNIQEGTYTFKLKAQSPDGVWSEPVIYTFKVLPPWYRTWWMYLIYGVAVIASGISFFRWRTASLRREKEKLERTVEERTAEVVEQKELIEEKQKEIVDSINYAKRIQYTLLANDKLLQKNLNKHFVFFQPKDIVSGDFYWATSVANTNRFYLAVCDSTGHGVPGAFMSLLNSSFLNEAITEKNIIKPNEILDYVRQRLIESISKEGGQDGMDGILICFENGLITYAAANNAPVIVRENEITYLPADKMPIGKGEKNIPFTLHTIDARKGDTLYFYTDGYADQFGGPKGKKFKYKQLNELLLNIHRHSMEQQKHLLAASLQKWKGNIEQVDDILIVGLQID